MPTTYKPRGCTHATLALVTAGEKRYALCEPCRRVWGLKEEGAE